MDAARERSAALTAIARIESLSHEGRGVARVEGKTVFVEGALIGEEVKLRYQRRRNRYDEACAVEILRPSPERVAPACAHFGVCGGCSLQHLAPAAQLRHKEAVLLEQLEHVGGVQPATVLPALAGPILGYRRRARLSVRVVARKGGVVVGFREHTGRRVADLHSCPVLDPAVGNSLEDLRCVLNGLSCRAQVPQVEVAVDEQGAALTLRHLQPLGAQDRAALMDAAARSGWRLYLQPRGADSVEPLCPDTPLLLRMQIPRHDVTLQFLPTDFIQVNRHINVAAIDRAIELLELSRADRVLDLFCGIGNFTLPIARRVHSVIGLEGDGGLVARAAENARINEITNAVFVRLDLARSEPPAGAFSKVLLDPPRSGALEILRRLRAKEVERLVYISCNPATLARDAGTLVHERGMHLESIGVMDMFPHTAHIESVALFRH